MPIESETAPACVVTPPPPSVRGIPVVVDSPHSGFSLPPDFGTVAPARALLTSCDRFVDELWGGAPAAGAVLLAATFPRAYVDANRSADDLDPSLVDGEWPGGVKTTDYSLRGMGVIRRLALPGVPMYDRRLSPAEIRSRLDRCYTPYRNALARAIDAAHGAFGTVWHLNVHSMKSRGNAMNVDAGGARPGFVVSDRLGTTANPAFTRWIAERLAGAGHTVKVNDPYKGGDLVRTFGRPSEGRHSVQIEVNRALYLDEDTYERGPRFGQIRLLLDGLMSDLRDEVEGRQFGCK